MERIHLAPFKAGVEDNIEMIMAAHLHCTCFDKEVVPSSLSKSAVGYLRKTLGYNGVVISDDMVMKGVQAYGSAEAVIMGIEAGLDMFIFRDADEQTIETIEKVVEIVNANESLKARVMHSNERISNLKQKYGI
jgi:beta-glucosidase-like glycosyl hydrolase